MSKSVDRPSFTREQLEWLRDAFAITPCHVTGMHDPTHTARYVCDLQRAAAYERTAQALGIAVVDPRRRLCDDDCYWCYEGEDKEKFAEWAARRPTKGGGEL